jgi:outer membrane biosynthesis protein TonB
MGAEATDRSPAPRRTAAAAAAEGGDSTLRSPRGGSWLRAFGFGAALGVVAFAVVALINSRGDDNNNVTIPASASSAQPPATVALPPGGQSAKPPAHKAAKPAAPKPAPAPAPKPKPAPAAKTKAPPATATAPPPAAPKPAPAAAKPTTLRCDPIYGGSTAYKVTSSAKGGKPTGCGQAHDVLLGALNGNAPGAWKCKTDTGASVIATCRSGGKTLIARK